MSLIRNGGFERGNTDFWEVMSGGTLEISSVSPLYGSYCGKFISSGDTLEDIISSDYISVISHQILDTIGYMKSTASRKVYPLIYLYDADYSFIEVYQSFGKWLDASYSEFHNQFEVPVGCAYIRFGYRIYSSASGEVSYLDAVMADLLSSESGMSGSECLIDYQILAASGDTSADKRDMQQFSGYFAQLSCTYAGGTSPTLDMTICEVNGEETELEIASFPQITATGTYLLELPNMLGKGIYCKYAVGGTSPQLQVTLNVIGKR